MIMILYSRFKNFFTDMYCSKCFLPSVHSVINVTYTLENMPFTSYPFTPTPTASYRLGIYVRLQSPSTLFEEQSCDLETRGRRLRLSGSQEFIYMFNMSLNALSACVPPAACPAATPPPTPPG